MDWLQRGRLGGLVGTWDELSLSGFSYRFQVNGLNLCFNYAAFIPSDAALTAKAPLQTSFRASSALLKMWDIV